MTANIKGKRVSFIARIVSTFVILPSMLLAQTNVDNQSSLPSQGNWRPWTVTAREESTTTREYTNNAASVAGSPFAPEVHRVVEVASGLNYLDTNNMWQESVSVIELTQDGKAAGVQGGNKVYFEPDLSGDRVITIVTKSNRVFTTRPIWIYYRDPTSGQAVLLATTTNSAQAELLPPNQIVYRGAFDSAAVKADLRLTYARGGIESDVIFTRKPKPPEDFSLNPAYMDEPFAALAYAASDRDEFDRRGSRFW